MRAVTITINNKLEIAALYIMINILPRCSTCGTPVADSVESEIKRHRKIKAGQYLRGIWICDDCIQTQQSRGKKTSESTSKNKNDSNDRIIL